MIEPIVRTAVLLAPLAALALLFIGADRLLASALLRRRIDRFVRSRPPALLR